MRAAPCPASSLLPRLQRLPRHACHAWLPLPTHASSHPPTHPPTHASSLPAGLHTARRSLFTSLPASASGSSSSSSSSSSGSDARPSGRAVPKACPGCGAAFQHHSETASGYIPVEALSRRSALSPDKIERLRNSPDPLTPGQVKTLLDAAKPFVPLCFRCHQLKNHSITVVPPSFKTDTMQFSDLKIRNGGIVVLVVDVYDLPGTLLPNLFELVGQKTTIIALNKIDLLPKTESVSDYADWVRKHNDVGKRAAEIVPVSTLRSRGMADLIAAIGRHRSPNEDIYMIGVTNSGKSSLINRLLDAAGHSPFLTTSTFAGTTLKPIGIPLSTIGPMVFPADRQTDGKGSHSPAAESQARDAKPPLPSLLAPLHDTGRLVDTAGAFNPTQLTHYLAPNEFKFVVPKAAIIHRQIRLRPDTILYFGALIRLHISNVTSTSVLFYYGSPSLLIHTSSSYKLESLWEKHAGVSSQLLTPPIGKDRINALPPFATALTLPPIPKGSALRVWLGGLGWVVIQGSLNGRFCTPNGTGLHLDRHILEKERWLARKKN
ncbi:P-loop containing nucleoside triphosphate hydrolase protein [Entophlyctis helioformis]|nr:P-loop containing nucleoside triphosphate hydrolase protein [Entophlyctis helioformis]